MGTGVFWYLGDVQGVVEFVTEKNKIMRPGPRHHYTGVWRVLWQLARLISVATEAMQLEDVQRGSAESRRNPLYLTEKFV